MSRSTRSAVFNVLATSLLAVVVVVLANSFIAGQVQSLPVHSTLEGVGGTLAIAIGGLLLWGRELYGQPSLEIVATGLFGQGILELGHAVVPPSPAFFWSRTLPTLFGGVVFSLVWFASRMTRGALRSLLYTTLILAMLGSGALVAAPNAWPAGFSINGEYTLWAKGLNVAGGLAFLLSSVFFYREHERTRSAVDGVFASHCLLFALAGMTFGIASLWDSAWWAFHALRFMAYVVSLGYVIDLLRRVSERHRVHSSTEMAEQLDELIALRRRLRRSSEAS